MNIAETILAPTQRIVVALVEDFVHSGKPSVNLLAPRGCGTTALFKSLIQYQGFGDLPIEFIYRSVRTTQTPSSMLACRPDCLGHRVVFLLDRAAQSESVCHLASKSDRIQWIKATSPSRFQASSLASLQLHLLPLDQDQIRRFIDLQKFTANGRSIQITDETIQQFAVRSGGRLRDLIPLIRSHLETTASATPRTGAFVTIQAGAPNQRAA